MKSSIGTQVYFADPYSSWKRGTPEIELLREFFPKGHDFLDNPSYKKAIPLSTAVTVRIALVNAIYALCFNKWIMLLLCTNRSR